MPSKKSLSDGRGEIMQYIIFWADGRPDDCYDTYEKAVETVATALGPEAIIGHDGDISDGGDITLCWKSAEEADGDHGLKAVVEIIRA